MTQYDFEYQDILDARARFVNRLIWWLGVVAIIVMVFCAMAGSAAAQVNQPDTLLFTVPTTDNKGTCPAPIDTVTSETTMRAVVWRPGIDTLYTATLPVGQAQVLDLLSRISGYWRGRAYVRFDDEAGNKGCADSVLVEVHDNRPPAKPVAVGAR